MLSILLLVSFILISSYCIFEVCFIQKLQNRLKYHKRYIVEFLSTKDSSGMSLERYTLYFLFPKYKALNITILIVGILGSLFYLHTLGLKIILGILSGLSIYLRVYNRSFFTALWDRVLPK